MSTRGKVLLALLVMAVAAGGFAAGKFLSATDEPLAANETSPACQAVETFRKTFQEVDAAYAEAQERFDEISATEPKTSTRYSLKQAAVDALSHKLFRLADRLRDLRYDLLVNHEQPLTADLRALSEAAQQVGGVLEAQARYWTEPSNWNRNLTTVDPPKWTMVSLPAEIERIQPDHGLVEVLWDRCAE